MKTVGVRELKNRLSEYLRMVRRGERILVTDRGEVVAQLCAPQPDAGEPAIPRGLVELARRGLATLPTRPGRPDYNLPPLSRKVPPGFSQRLLDEIRGDR